MSPCLTFTCGAMNSANLLDSKHPCVRPRHLCGLHGRSRHVTCRSATADSALDIPEPLPLEQVRPPKYHQFKILYKDEHLVAVDKPRGFYVHPPEDGRVIPFEENGLWLLKRQLHGKYLYPVHRLDRATSGVVLYCLTADAASVFNKSMRDREVRKVYHALTRGYTPTYGIIDDDIGGAVSTTLFTTLARCQIPLKVGKWQMARYSLLHLEPLTGRFHQLRRHLNYASHPIIGDGDHGDRYHNRAFLNELKLKGMYLRATTLELTHPITGQPLSISVDSWEDRWHTVFDMMGICPVLPPTNHAKHALQRHKDTGLLQQQVELSRQPLDEVWRLSQLQQSPDVAVSLPSTAAHLQSHADGDAKGQEAVAKQGLLWRAASRLVLSEQLPRYPPVPWPMEIGTNTADSGNEPMSESD